MQRSAIVIATLSVLLQASEAFAKEPFLCRLIPTAHFEIRDNVHTHNHAWQCLRVIGSGPKEIRIDDNILGDIDVWSENFFLKVNEYSSETDFVQNAQVLGRKEAESFIDSSRRTLLRKEKQVSTHERALTATGTHMCGIVVVNAVNIQYNEKTVAELESKLYVDSSSQYKTCSKNALSLEKKDPTIEITLPNRLGTYKRDTVYDAARTAVCQYYGLNNQCEPATARGLDHILYVLPFGINGDEPNSFWAFADVGGYRGHSVYGSGFFATSTILHELGHNLNLGHAFDENDEYGDITGQMGSGGGAKRCFNGYNMYTMGWLGSQTISLSGLGWNTYNNYQLHALDDMNIGGTVVNIKIDDIYLLYNMDKGRNADTKEYPDHVLIHQGLDINFGESNWDTYDSTTLLNTLGSVNDCWSRPSDSLFICICDIDKVGSNGVKLSIGLNSHGCDDDPGDPEQEEETDSGGGQNYPTSETGTGMTLLVSGESVTIAAEDDEVVRFAFELSSNAVGARCSISGGSGDADLMINRAQKGEPLVASPRNDCLPYKYGNEEACNVVGGGVALYVFVHAYNAFEGVELLCKEEKEKELGAEISSGTNEAVELFDRVPRDSLTALTGEVLRFFVNVPVGAGSISCALFGSSGDGDLIMRFDGEPEVTSSPPGVNACYPSQPGSSETCMDVPVTDDVLFVSVHAFEAFEDISIVCASHG